MTCIEPDRNDREIEVRAMMAAAAQKARDAAIAVTEAAVLTYNQDGIWINPAQAKEIEFALRQAMASTRHVMRHCGLTNANT